MAEGEEKNEILDSMPVFAKELIAGGVTGGIAKTAVAPLERIKILFQTRRDEFKRIGLVGSINKIGKTEGLMGFYRGNGASVARIVPYAALHYMAYEEYRRWIIFGFPDTTRGPLLDLVAGSFAGGTAVLFTYPLDLVRTKLAYQCRLLVQQNHKRKVLLSPWSKSCTEESPIVSREHTENLDSKAYIVV